MQKHSAETEKHLCLIYRWRFWVGFTLNLGSEVGLTSTALYLAPLSFIAPLAGLAVVFNALIARLGLVAGTKEKMGYNEWCVCFPLKLQHSQPAPAHPTARALQPSHPKNAHPVK